MKHNLQKNKITEKGWDLVLPMGFELGSARVGAKEQATELQIDFVLGSGLEERRGNSSGVN